LGREKRKGEYLLKVRLLLPLTCVGCENYYNRKANDSNGSNEKLFPFDAVWQSYILLGDRIPHFDPASLRLVVRNSVVNISTRRGVGA
jgi:hypothetical protein